MQLKVVLAFAVFALASAEEAAVKTATEATAEVKGAAAHRQSLRAQIAATATADCSAGTTGCVECCGLTQECCVQGTSCQSSYWGQPSCSSSW